MKKRWLALALLMATLGANAQTDSTRKQPEQPKPWETADWANRKRYQADNEKFGTFKPGQKGVIFMGDSITDVWITNDSSFWSSNPFLDRGISGQTTTQMLVRFRPDVIDLKPSVVVILAGINDIAQNNGPISIQDVFGNLQSMAILAKEAGIKVVLCSVLPANHFPWRSEIVPTDKVGELNALLKAYAQKNNIVYLDYYSKMADDQRGLPKNLATDGIHPTLEGYRIMEPMVQTAIAEALKKK